MLNKYYLCSFDAIGKHNALSLRVHVDAESGRCLSAFAGNPTAIILTNPVSEDIVIMKSDGTLIREVTRADMSQTLYHILETCHDYVPFVLPIQ